MNRDSHVACAFEVHEAMNSISGCKANDAKSMLVQPMRQVVGYPDVQPV